MFTTLLKPTQPGSAIPGVKFDRSKWTPEETPMGVDTWSNAFSGLDQYGLGGFGSISPTGDPNNPSGFTIRRENPSGDPMAYQTRGLTVNPDGSVSWNGDWQDARRVSDAEFWRDGLALAAAGAGAAGYLGSTIAGGAGGIGGLSGMDLAADAALGAGNNITTAGSMLSGAGGIAGTGIPAYAQGAGYGDTVATLADASGASPFTGGAATAASDPITAYLTTGASEGSTIGNALTGAGGAAGAVGAGSTASTMGTIGSILEGAKSFAGGSGGLLNLGGNLLNSYLGYNAANKAADAQINASREANALAKYMYDTTRTDNMPALNARNTGLEGYQKLLQNPGTITSDPGYQFGLQQGMNAYDNSGAARGMRLSGAQAKALTKFGQDYGQTKFNESLNRYGNLAGLGQTGAGTIANAGMNYSNTAGSNMLGAGNAAASGYIGGANAISGGISNFLKNFQENQLLKQLGLGG